MANACPMQSPAERRYADIQRRTEDEMLRKVSAAILEATEQTQAEIEAAGLDMPPPPSGYFTSVVHQYAYCTLCGADPKTFAGGDPTIALAVIRNAQNITSHYWGAEIEPSAPRQSDRPAPD